MTKKFFDDIEIEDCGVKFIIKPYIEISDILTKVDDILDEADNMSNDIDPLNYIKLDSIKVDNIEMLEWFKHNACQTYKDFCKLAKKKIYKTLINSALLDKNLF